MMDFTPAESQQAVAALAAEILGEPDPWKELARAGLLTAEEAEALERGLQLPTSVGRETEPEIESEPDIDLTRGV